VIRAPGRGWNSSGRRRRKLAPHRAGLANAGDVADVLQVNEAPRSEAGERKERDASFAYVYRG